MALEIRNWSDADIEQLAAMRSNGQTYTQIANVFNVTRHAVAGILFRKFPTLRTPSKPRHVVRKLKPKPAAKAKETGPLVGPALRSDQWPQIPAEPVPKIPLKGSKRTMMLGDFGGWEEREALRVHRRLFGPGDPLPLIHLGRCQCRYAVVEDPKALGGWLFCAQPTEPDESYCPLHREAIYAVGRK